MQTAQFRFYAELNDFFAENMKQKSQTVEFLIPSSVKDMIESMGVPHTEIDLIIVNGKSVDFNYHVQDKDEVHVYPVFETFDISPIIKLRPEPLRNPRFVADCHLGRLAKYMRLLGFDTVYENDLDDTTIAKISMNDTRIILTKDRGLLKRKSVMHGYYVREVNPKNQVAEVIKRFDLRNMTNPFTRCLKCNGTISRIKKEIEIERLLENIKTSYREFFICNECDQIYWKGSHYEKMLNLINSMIDPLQFISR